MIKKRNKSKERGITLIALVVTIVVLLILAGVTITYVLGDHGIFKLAQEVKNKTDETIKSEQEDLDKLYSSIKVADNSTVTLTMEQLDKYIEKKLEEKNRSTPKMDYEHAIDVSSYTSEDNKFTCPKNGVLEVSFQGNAIDTKNCLVHISGAPIMNAWHQNANFILNDCHNGIISNATYIVNVGQTIYFSFINSPSTLYAYFIPFN